MERKSIRTSKGRDGGQPFHTEPQTQICSHESGVLFGLTPFAFLGWLSLDIMALRVAKGNERQ